MLKWNQNVVVEENEEDIQEIPRKKGTNVETKML